MNQLIKSPEVSLFYSMNQEILHYSIYTLENIEQIIIDNVQEDRVLLSRRERENKMN